MTIRTNRTTLLIVLNALILCVLSLSGSTGAAPPSGQQPFNNAVEQRNQMIQELQEIKSLIKEQNGLLRDVLGKTNAHAKTDRTTVPGAARPAR